ncbi:hypothetical protein AYO43_08775 [Nitrospira sp. SCGC AG-212-E16]|nr:hypothetical protein AYO43_08775 [Nitrospira sp. SCGC AG-212-E16]
MRYVESLSDARTKLADFFIILLGDIMAKSTGRKTVGVSRGLMMLCETCYAQVIADKLTDEKNFVANADLLFDTICFGCTDINRPLIDDMAGSGE